MFTEAKPKKGGRPPALSGDKAYLTAFALGQGLDPRMVATCLSVSSSTVCRFAERLQLGNDPESQRLLLAIYEHGRREPVSKTQNPGADESSGSL